MESNYGSLTYGFTENVLCFVLVVGLILSFFVCFIGACLFILVGFVFSLVVVLLMFFVVVLGVFCLFGLDLDFLGCGTVFLYYYFSKINIGNSQIGIAAFWV